MTAAGTVRDTYAAALQHDLVSAAPEAVRVGVVRRPTPWFYGVVDENHPALGPPDALLDEFKDAHEDLKLRGMCDEGAHNAAWEETGFDERYRAHLAADEAAQAALDDLRDRVAAGADLLLVCFENTDRKRCHRTVLRELLTADG